MQQCNCVTLQGKVITSPSWTQALIMAPKENHCPSLISFYYHKARLNPVCRQVSCIQPVDAPNSPAGLHLQTSEQATAVPTNPKCFTALSQHLQDEGWMDTKGESVGILAHSGFPALSFSASGFVC